MLAGNLIPLFPTLQRKDAIGHCKRDEYTENGKRRIQNGLHKKSIHDWATCLG